MNPNLKQRITRTLASLAGAALVTFTGLQLIVDYALPERSASAGVQLAAAATPTLR